MKKELCEIEKDILGSDFLISLKTKPGEKGVTSSMVRVYARTKEANWIIQGLIQDIKFIASVKKPVVQLQVTFPECLLSSSRYRKVIQRNVKALSKVGAKVKYSKSKLKK